jgi:3-oxoacyl-[acyl-carrier protein] reductase
LSTASDCGFIDAKASKIMNTSRLSGRVALVTGAGRGIGRAVALALAEQGVRMALAARSTAELERVRSEIQETGVEAAIFSTNLMDVEAPQQLVGAVIRAFGGLDILVNDAGTAVAKPISSTTVEEWDLLMAINARVPFLLCREALPHLKKSGRGRIVNIGSVVGYKGYVNQGAYTASKHALAGFTKVLAQEVMADGIRVHLVSPGGVDTQMANQMRPDLDRPGLTTPGEVAETVLFLLSQEGNAVIDEVNIRRPGKSPWI